jgi:transposase, IS5 family
MICENNPDQLSLAGFESFFKRELDKNNRWVKLAGAIPWDRLSEVYTKNLSAGQGRPAKPARLVIGAVIIKHKLCLSDEETVQQIQENPYLQYFVGFSGFKREQPFAPSLFVEIRRRMGEDIFDSFEQAIIEELEKKKVSRSSSKRGGSGGGSGSSSKESVPDDPKDEITHHGKLILDATVAEQAIRFPTDLGLLNESREISEKIIDELYPLSGLEKKPRSYRRTARKKYLAIVKQRKPGAKKIRRGIREQLQYLRRNLGHVEMLLDKTPIVLPYKLLRKYWIIQHVWRQQEEMYRTKSKSCADRIVSISQPHVRPIVRGKAHKKAEFGAKLSVSLTGDGIARVDRVSWDACNEGQDLIDQVEGYKERYGYYPEVVLADTLYGTRDNRKYLKNNGIRYAGKPLGRPKKETEGNRQEIIREKKQRQEEYRQRIPIEGKFGQGKNGYRLNYIRAKSATTSETWIKSIFLVMNLLVLARIFILQLKRWYWTIMNTLPSALKGWIVRRFASQGFCGAAGLSV